MRKILYCSYEFRSSYQRGIYQFTKSMIDATQQLGFENYLLTQARNPDEIIHSLVKADQYANNKFEASLAYVQFLLGTRKKFTLCGAQYSDLDGFEFLSKLRGYVNYPLFYNSSHYSVIFPNSIGMTNIALRDFHQNDIIFCSSPMTVKSNKHKVVQVVHDVIHLKDRSKWERYMHRRISAANYANQILTVSEYSRSQFLEFFPHLEDRTHVVYQPVPVDEALLKLSEDLTVQDQVLQKYGVKRNSYMYYVGALNAGKNIHRMVQAYHLATKGDLERPLLLSGKVDSLYFKENNIYAYISTHDKPEKNKNVHLTGYVTDLEKLCLLRCCRAFLFPSLGEGFGIPVIEAQICGAPVLTSNNTSLPEVTNDAAIYIYNPKDLDELRSQINLLFEDDALLNKLRKLGYLNTERFDKRKLINQMHCIFNDLRRGN